MPKKATKKVAAEVVAEVVPEAPDKASGESRVYILDLKTHDPKMCAGCGIRYNIATSKHDELRFCSPACYNKIVKIS